MPKKILFISHDAFRAGAQILLLHMLNWLKEHKKDIQFDTLLIDGGALQQQFMDVSKSVYIYSTYKKSSVTLKDKIKQVIKPQKTVAHLFKKLKKENYDLIYANSVVSLPIGVDLKHVLKCKLLLHVHELDTVIKERVPNFYSLHNTVDEFIAASQLVKNNLIDSYAVPANKVHVIYEFSKLNMLKQDDIILEGNEFVVGGSGSISFRKGFDLFIQTAQYVNKKHPECLMKFVWVGGGKLEKTNADEEVKKLGLETVVIFTGEKENPSNYFKKFSVFLLTSREDPFPLVCIETAQLKKPIICFKGVTGTAEVLEKGGGFIVPFPNVEAMGDKIVEYYKNKELLNKDGNMAGQLFSRFTPEIICPEIFELILKTSNSSVEA